jgi:hypothetical protein
LTIWAVPNLLGERVLGASSDVFLDRDKSGLHVLLLF